jgi:hypothetical protein
MVIFSAGASHDSIVDMANKEPQVGWPRPPLAAHLFDAAFNAFVRDHRASGTLVSELRSIDATVDLETALDRIQLEEAPRSATRRRELMALRYYLRDLLWTVGTEWEDRFAPGQTNYHNLLKRLELWREKRGNEVVALVSFNYDTILDGAVRDVHL